MEEGAGKESGGPAINLLPHKLCGHGHRWLQLAPLGGGRGEGSQVWVLARKIQGDGDTGQWQSGSGP